MFSNDFYNTGCPRVVRCDGGTENNRIAFLQPFLRWNGQDAFAGEKSFQYGRSASNQVQSCITLNRNIIDNRHECYTSPTTVYTANRSMVESVTQMVY